MQTWRCYEFGTVSRSIVQHWVQVWARNYSAEDASKCDCDALQQALGMIDGAERMVSSGLVPAACPSMRPASRLTKSRMANYPVRSGCSPLQVVGHTIQRRGINSACDAKVLRIDVGLSGELHLRVLCLPQNFPSTPETLRLADIVWPPCSYPGFCDPIFSIHPCVCSGLRQWGATGP